MVLIKNPVKSVMLPLALGSIMIIDGCKKDEPVVPTQTDLLVGDWQIVELDGEAQPADADYNILFKFEADGDWRWCYEYPASPADNVCDYNGKWSWQDADETTIVINEIIGFAGEWTIDVVSLDATTLNGSLIIYEGYSISVKFEKVP